MTSQNTWNIKKIKTTKPLEKRMKKKKNQEYTTSGRECDVVKATPKKSDFSCRFQTTADDTVHHLMGNRKTHWGVKKPDQGHKGNRPQILV